MTGRYSHLVPTHAREAVETYKLACVAMGEWPHDYPPELGDSLLALHQNVLMVWLFDSDRDLDHMRSLIAPDGTVRWPERGA
jgi:hypothetical protein